MATTAATHMSLRVSLGTGPRAAGDAAGGGEDSPLPEEAQAARGMVNAGGVIQRRLSHGPDDIFTDY